MKDCHLTDDEWEAWEARRKIAKARNELEKTAAKKMLEAIGFRCGFDRKSEMLTVLLGETSMNDKTFSQIRQYLEEKEIYVGLLARLPENSGTLYEMTAEN